MREVHFADGFDVTEPLALGLSPAQLLVGVTGLLAGYAAVHSGLPTLPAVATAVIVGAVTAALTLLRHEGRPLVEWAGPALGYAGAPRRGRLLRLEPREDVTTSIAMPAPDTYILPAGHRNPAPAELSGRGPEIVRRPPLVLLREPIAAPASGRDSGENELGEADAWASTPIHHHREAGEAGNAGTPMPASEPLGPSPAAACPVFVGATRRITFFSLRGGSGRTTLATEVASLLAAHGRHRDPATGATNPLSVALLDLDHLSPSVGLRLGAVPRPDAERQTGCFPQSRLDGPILDHRTGLRVLLAPAAPPPSQGGRIEAGQLGAIVEHLERNGTQFIVFDIAADLGEIDRWVLEAAHDIFVVLTPSAGGVLDAYRSTAVLRRMGMRHKLRYVVNHGRGSDDLGEAMADLGGRIDAEIAEDPEIAVAEHEHTLAGLEGSGPAADGLRQLTARIYPGLDAGEECGDPEAESGWRRRGWGWRRRAG